jgi:HEAT repeat protein
LIVRGALLVLACLLLFSFPATAGERPISELVAELGGADANLRNTALNELRNRKDPRVIPLLVEALPGFEYIGQYFAFMILDVFPPKQTMPAFRALVKSDQPYVRLAAATSLLRLGERKAVPVIVEALLTKDVPTNTRMYMLNRLYSIRDPEVLAAVRSFLVPGEDPVILGSVMNLLANQQDAASRAACEKLLADPRPGVKAMALAFLYRMGDEARAVALAKALESGEIEYSEFQRVRMLLYVMPRVSAEILDAVVVMLETEENTNILTQAIGLLAKFRHRKAIPLLKKLLDHENRLVAKAAFEALAGLGGALDEDTLRPLLDSEDIDRRLMAADALRRMDDDTGLPVLIEILSTGANQQRADAAKSLGGFRRAEVVEPLLAALLDDYTTTRMYAESGLRAVLQALFPYRRLDFGTVGLNWNSSLESRKAAAERIRKWWLANREREW